MALGKDISLRLRKEGREGEGDVLHLQNSSLPPLDTAALASPSPVPQGCTWTPTCPALHLNPIRISKSSVICPLDRERNNGFQVKVLIRMSLSVPWLFCDKICCLQAHLSYRLRKKPVRVRAALRQSTQYLGSLQDFVATKGISAEMDRGALSGSCEPLPTGSSPALAAQDRHQCPYVFQQ